MGENSKNEPRWYRKVFGRPRVFNGAIYLVLGGLWFVVMATTRTDAPWPFIVGGLWLLLGLVGLTVAVRDRRLSRGSYAPTAAQQPTDAGETSNAGR